MKLAFSLLAVIILITPARSQQACTAAATHGTYSVMCTGYIAPAANASQVPISVIGTVTGDFAGTFTGSAKVSMGGAILDQQVTGTLVSNGDCTGTIAYTQKINGQPAPNLNIVAHTLDSGQEIIGMSVDQGTTMTCRLVLLHR